MTVVIYDHSFRLILPSISGRFDLIIQLKINMIHKIIQIHPAWHET